jgi:hypothetical protein
MKHLNHFRGWWLSQDHLQDAGPDIALHAYTQTFPGRTIPLMTELLEDYEEAAKWITRAIDTVLGDVITDAQRADLLRKRPKDD